MTLIIVCTFGLCGISLVSLGIAQIFSNRKFARNAMVADGIVIDLKTSKGKHGEYYSPIVEFIEKENKKIRFTSNIFQSESTYKEGDHVNVFYDQDLVRIELADTLKNPGIPLCFSCLGIIFLLISAVSILIINR